MSDREKLIDILIDTFDNQYNQRGLITPQHTADHLIAKGVTIQKRGKWRLNKDGSGTCSECHRTQNDAWDYDTWQRYCGDCGAKMGEADDNDIN